MSSGRVPHPSIEERAALRRAARSKIPRSAHADWEPTPERRPPDQAVRAGRLADERDD